MISKAIEVNDGIAAFHADLGVVLKAQGKLGDAIACYEQALAIKPDYVETLLTFGNALQVQCKLPQHLGRSADLTIGSSYPKEKTYPLPRRYGDSPNVFSATEACGRIGVSNRWKEVMPNGILGRS